MFHLPLNEFTHSFKSKKQNNLLATVERRNQSLSVFSWTFVIAPVTSYFYSTQIHCSNSLKTVKFAVNCCAVSRYLNLLTKSDVYSQKTYIYMRWWRKHLLKHRAFVLRSTKNKYFKFYQTWPWKAITLYYFYKKKHQKEQLKNLRKSK
jgi:hypothetical protein